MSSHTILPLEALLPNKTVCPFKTMRTLLSRRIVNLSLYALLQGLQTGWARGNFENIFGFGQESPNIREGQHVVSLFQGTALEAREAV